MIGKSGRDSKSKIVEIISRDRDCKYLDCLSICVLNDALTNRNNKFFLFRFYRTCISYDSISRRLKFEAHSLP